MEKPDARADILDAAAHCFARCGVEAASIDLIARHMGATKGKVYHHFRSKGELLCEVRLRAVQFTQDQVHGVFERPAPPAEKFREMALEHSRAIIERFDYHRVVVENIRPRDAGLPSEFERAKQTELLAAHARYEDMFRQVITDGQKSGAFRDQPVSILMHSVLTLLNAPIFWYTPRPEQTAEERDAICQQMAGMALAAVR